MGHVELLRMPAVAISKDERAVFKRPGARVAGLRKARKAGPAPKLQEQIEQISQLPRAKRRVVIEMLDTVLQQTG